MGSIPKRNHLFSSRGIGVRKYILAAPSGGSPDINARFRKVEKTSTLVYVSVEEFKSQLVNLFN